LSTTIKRICCNFFARKSSLVQATAFTKRKQHITHITAIKFLIDFLKGQLGTCLSRNHINSGAKLGQIFIRIVLHLRFLMIKLLFFPELWQSIKKYHENVTRLSITNFILYFIKIKSIKFFFFFFFFIYWHIPFVSRTKTILIRPIDIGNKICVSWWMEKQSCFRFLEQAGSRVKVILHPRIDPAAELITCQADTRSNLKLFTNLQM